MASGSGGVELMEEITGGWSGIKQWSAPRAVGFLVPAMRGRIVRVRRRNLNFSVLSVASELCVAFEILRDTQVACN